MTALKYWQVDAFTKEPFKGNPAAVFVLNEDIPGELKQNIALELNLSETAFVCINDRVCEIKWFTPETEVNLCGHATLAASHILWEQKFVDCPMLRFDSRSGVLKVNKRGQDYCLDFPSQPPVANPRDRETIEDILGQKPVFTGSNGEDCMAVVEDSDFVRNFEPDIVRISQLQDRGFLLSAPDSSGQYDYVYRAFFPKLGIREDPVTGSANTLLGPYWSQRLGKTSLKAFQASKRSGELGIEISEDRVLISGPAVTICEAQLKI